LFHKEGKINRKNVSILLIASLFISFGAVSVATNFGWWVRLRFQFGLIPFEEPKSPCVAMTDVERGGLVIRPISDRYTLELMDFIASVVKGEETEVILEGKHPDVLSLMNRTIPRFNMGYLNSTRIRVFGTEYDVWYLEMWVRDEALYLNIRFQGLEHVVEKVYLIEDPELAMKAYDIMVEAWQKS